MSAIVAVYARHLRDNKGLLTGLAVGMAVFTCLTMVFFPTFKDQGELMMKVMPSFVRQLMGNRVPWNTVEGFATWEYTHPICIAMSAAWVVAYGGRAIAGGIERRTLGLVLAGPISRTRYYWACVAALLSGELIVLGVCNIGFGSSFYALGMPPRGGPIGILVVTLQGMLLYGSFGALILGASAMVSEAGKAYLFGSILVLVSLFVVLFAPVVEPLKRLESLSLFHYFQPYKALRGLAIPTWQFLVPMGVMAAALGLGWSIFVRRDLSL